MKLREKYVFLLAALFFLIIVVLLVAALSGDSFTSAAAPPIRHRHPVRDAAARRWEAAAARAATAVGGDHDGAAEFQRIQQQLLINASKDPLTERRNYVKGMMAFAWSGYRQFAWGENELRPETKIPHSESVFGAAPLGASLVDSLDTLWLMGLKEEFAEAREWLRTEFDLTNARAELSVFETNIRFVGGLLSTYALTNDSLFLEKAREVADHLLPAFETPTGVPYALVNVNTGRAQNWGWASSGCSILSEFGSLELEFRQLSLLTGNQTYAQKVQRIRDVLAKATMPEDGLFPNYLNPRTGKFCQKHVSMGALGDSFYEYLLKTWLWSGRRDTQAKQLYDSAIAAVERKLLFRSKQSQLYYFADLKGSRVEHKMDHLACFTAGMYALQSRNEWDPEKARHALKMGKEIGKTCHESYIRTATGLGPEAFRFTNEVEAKAIRDTERYYILRPEVVEGWFFLWRVTGDPIYREWAWDVVKALDRHCRVDGGFSGIRNVDEHNVHHDDVQQSFILAETLKYLWLIFADNSVLPIDEWVFNTEAHPIPINRVEEATTLQTTTVELEAQR